MKNPRFLVLVKHSNPEIVPDRPANQWSLSKEGRQRCHALISHLYKYKPELVISSHEPKASQTAEIIAGHFDIPCKVAEGLHEQDRTNVPFLSACEFQDSAARLFQNPDKLVWGKETANDALNRFEQSLRLVLASNRKKNIIAVTHGTVMSLFVAKYNNVDSFMLWQKLTLPSFVVLAGAKFKLINIVYDIDKANQKYLTHLTDKC